MRLPKSPPTSGRTWPSATSSWMVRDSWSMAASGDSASGDGCGDGGGDDASTDELDSGLGTRPGGDGPAGTAVLAWVAVTAEAGLAGRSPGEDASRATTTTATAA